MDANLFDITAWADRAGALQFWGVMLVIVSGTALKLFAGARWDDWLDERWGRGSVRDRWLLRRIERDAQTSKPDARAISANRSHCV
jgi:hypothetical protein